MQVRSRLVTPAAGLAALLCLATGAPASGAPTTPAALPHVTAQSVGSASGMVQLVTGERVRLVRRDHATVVEVDHAAAGGQRALVTRTAGSRTTVTPVVAQPYLGRFLDRSLFDVSTLGRATAANGRIAVRLTYRGSSRPTVPGVHLTSAAGGTARGYLTPSSAAAFGRALTAQFEADRKAGWPERSSVLGGVTRISADATAATTVSPRFTMYTLVVKAIGSNGKPASYASLGALNVDDGRRYANFVDLIDGEARISVPAGRYSMIADEFSGDADRIVTVNEYRVTRSGQVVTLDFRTAKARSSVTTPKPASSTSYGFEWDRTDARGQFGLGSGFSTGSPADIRLAPAAAPKVGTVAVVQSFGLSQKDSDDPSYTYDLSALDDHVPAKPGKTFTADDLGVVSAEYYGDGATRQGGFGRAPLYPTTGFVFIGLAPVARPTVRTEYVGSLGRRPLWLEVGLLNGDSFEDPGFVDAAPRSVTPASVRTSRWFRGPLAPAVPVQTAGAYCYDCRSGNSLLVALPPFTDSDPTHVGEAFGAADGLSISRFRLYRGNTLLTDQDDAFGALVDVPATAATYRAVLDVDRRLVDPVQSTRTQTEWSFRSARGSGPKVGKDWYCDSGETDCRVLPVVQARVALPTDLQGRLPAGRSTVVVNAGRAQGAAAAKVTEATLEVRGQGYDWQPVPLHPDGPGRYTAVVDDADYAGGFVDVRVSTADQSGSTFRQTTLRAYRVAGS